MPEHLLKILTTLEKDVTHQPWKLIRNSGSFTLIINFPAKGDDKGKRKPSKERASGLNSARQHTDKKHQDSSGVRLAEQPKRKKKKNPARVARDRARRRAYWKVLKIARKLSAENTAAHYAQLQETDYGQLAPKTTRPKTTRPKENSPQDNSPHIQKTTRPIQKTTRPTFKKQLAPTHS